MRGSDIEIAIQRSYTLLWNGTVESGGRLNLQWQVETRSGEEIYEFYPFEFKQDANTPRMETRPASGPKESSLIKAQVGSGEVTRDEKDKGRHCSISSPLSPPRRFPKGTTTVLFQFEFDPDRISPSAARIVGMDFPNVTIETACCQRYAILMGQPKVDRVACKVSRADKQSFKSGKYRFVVFGSDASLPEVELPFEVQ